MLWVFAPAVVVVDVVEDDDGHPLTAVGREGLEVKKSRDRPCPVLHPLGQLVVTQGGGLRAQSGPQHRDDRGEAEEAIRSPWQRTDHWRGNCPVCRPGDCRGRRRGGPNCSSYLHLQISLWRFDYCSISASRRGAGHQVRPPSAQFEVSGTGDDSGCEYLVATRVEACSRPCT